MNTLGTVLPGIYYVLANLGQNPLVFDKKLDIDVWGSTDAARYMMDFMPKESKQIKEA